MLAECQHSLTSVLSNCSNVQTENVILKAVEGYSLIPSFFDWTRKMGMRLVENYYADPPPHMFLQLRILIFFTPVVWLSLEKDSQLL